MEIPFNHDYTLCRAWKVAKMYFVKDKTSSMGLLDKRSENLRQMCEAFYPKNQEMLDEDDLPEEHQDAPIDPPTDEDQGVMILGTTTYIGLGGHQALSPHKCSIYDSLTESVERQETEWSCAQTKLCSSKDMLLTSPNNNTQPGSLPISVNDDPTLQVTQKGTDQNTRNRFESEDSTIDHQPFDALFEQKPVMAYFNYFSPEEDIFPASEFPEPPSSPVSTSSDETRVNTSSRSQTPEMLGLTLENQIDSDEPWLQDPNAQKIGIEGERTVLAPCCTIVKEEWEGLVKIIEDNHETEIANMEEDFDFEKKKLQAECDEAQSLSMSLESEKSSVERDHQDTLRKLREKEKEVRELKRALKTKAKALETKGDLESAQASTIQELQSDLAAQKEELVKANAASVHELNVQHHNDTLELRKALHDRSEELNQMADMAEAWKSHAEMLQAQHNDRCESGMSCVQQVQDLKNQVGTQQRLLRENWPLMEQEVQEANTQTAVAQKSLEDFRTKVEKEANEATQRYAQLDLKMKITSQKYEQARKLLLSDDTEAASVQVLESSAQELAKLMEENHEKVVEIHDLYQKRNTIMRNFQDQIDTVFTYLGELEVERNNYQASSMYFEGEFMTLRDKYSELEQANTRLQTTNIDLRNNLQIKNNDLRIANARSYWGN